MKKIIFRSFLAVLILGGPAIAADMPIKARVPAVAASYNWSGFYIGANVGYGWRSDRSGDLTTPTPGVPATGDVVPFPGTSFRASGNSSGLLGGVQLGYNVQAPGSAFVMGVEADWQWANFGRGNGPDTGFARALPTFNTPGLGVASNGGAASNIFFFDGNRTDWFATVRGRVGVAWDRTLLYATGGLAIRDNRGGGGITNGGALPATFFATVDGAAAAAGVTASGAGRNNFGGAIGGGIEHAFSNNLSVKVEGLWLLFGGNTSGRVVGVTNMGAPINTSSSDNDLGIVRVGLNWKLGGFAAR